MTLANVNLWLLATFALLLCILVYLYSDSIDVSKFQSLSKKERVCQIPSIPSSDRQFKPRIALLMVYEYGESHWSDELMARVMANRIDYVERHGYALINANDLIDRSRPVAWSKLTAVEAHLKSNQYDYILHVDTDVVIMNPNRKMEDYLIPNKDFIMNEDLSGLNSGVWLARNSNFTKWFLRTAYDQTQLLEKSSPEGIMYPFGYEQRSFHYMTNSPLWQSYNLTCYSGNTNEINSHIFFLQQCALNSYIWGSKATKYAHGDFLIHFAGLKGDKKTALMEKYLTVAEKSYVRGWKTYNIDDYLNVGRESKSVVDSIINNNTSSHGNDSNNSSISSSNLSDIVLLSTKNKRRS